MQVVMPLEVEIAKEIGEPVRLRTEITEGLD